MGNVTETSDRFETLFSKEIEQLGAVLKSGRRLLLTAPGAADGDSIGAQLALRTMLRHRYPKLEIAIVNDEPLPPRYAFLSDVQHVDTPESYAKRGGHSDFDIGICVDGGIDRAGRLQEVFGRCEHQIFIDHHAVSIEYPYTIRIVEPNAAATTELIYYLSQTKIFGTPEARDFAEFIYLGLIFDTGFFRHSNTTPEVMELAARLLRTGFDFTRVGERGMLERSFSSLQLMSYTLSRAKMTAGGRIIWSILTQETLQAFHAIGDDREGIIDHLFLTNGIEVAVLFFELPQGRTKVSLRSQGSVDVASFARSLTEHGGGHRKAAGAHLEMPVGPAVDFVLSRLEEVAKAPG